LGNTTITVRYGRKQTDKLGDGSFDSIELGTDLTLEVADDESPIELFNKAYSAIAEAVETKLADYMPREIKGTHTPTPYAPDERKEAEAEPPKELVGTSAKSGRGWIEDSIAKNTEEIRKGMDSLPGERIQTKQPGKANAIDEYGTPSTEIIVPNEAVMYQRARVFEVKADKASNGNLFVKVRIGKRGEDGIPGQYTTCRSYEADVIKQVAFFDKDEGQWNYKFRDGDFVDVWGYFKPWKGDDTKFDLELQKIQLHEE
jgi:hypothetical protein